MVDAEGGWAGRSDQDSAVAGEDDLEEGVQDGRRDDQLDQ